MEEPSGQPVRILLVEDHDDSAKAFARLLRTQGYDVQTAGGCEAALEAAAQRPFDVLMCDIGLPDGDGCDLMRTLLEMYPIKGIAVSGSGFPEDVAKCKAAGFSGHVLKPVLFDKVVAMLKSLA